MRVSIRILLAMILSLTSLVAQEGVVIESYRWGFDGTVKTQDLNLLTVEVKNAGGEPYDGEVRVRPGSMGLGGSSSIRKRCFLLPGQRRTLQFVLYVAESFNSVTVTIRRGERKVIDDMDEGAGSIILLESSDPLKVTQAPLPRFPEREFPVRGYATAGLSAVILDHVPEFTRAQRQAFLDWLRGGGRVHLYQATGQYPRFGDDLSILNDPRESFRLGMGYVHRSPLSIAEAVRRKSLPDATQTKRRYGSSYSHTTTQILDVLRRTVWPNHNWAVIYLILFAFFMASVPWLYFVC